MKLREYLLKTAAIDVLMALNDRIKDEHKEYMCLGEILDWNNVDYFTCDGDCNKCLAAQLDKEVDHG